MQEMHYEDTVILSIYLTVCTHHKFVLLPYSKVFSFVSECVNIHGPIVFFKESTLCHPYMLYAFMTDKCYTRNLEWNIMEQGGRAPCSIIPLIGKDFGISKNDRHLRYWQPITSTSSFPSTQRDARWYIKHSNTSL